MTGCWTATRGSMPNWAAVRAAWDKVAATKGGIAIQEEAQAGTIISARLLTMADEIVEGKLTEGKATAEALKLIDDNTRMAGARRVASTGQ